ncbi:MAG: DUF2855 family protein [Bacteroidota bacterium]
MNQLFLVEKNNIYQVRSQQEALAPLQEGEVRLAIEKYALTTNNITYAVSGFKLKYWNFFPAEEPYGVIPVWGYGRVIDTKQPEINIGERYYGYFPMATYCTVVPHKVKAFGFSDSAAHRQEMAPVYNQYLRVAAAAEQDAAVDNYTPIIKPLFATSFLIYQFLKSQAFLDAEQLIITSASSKTSLALAFNLHQHQATDGKKIIGLTSARNAQFVQGTAYYDSVLAYEDHLQIDPQKAVIVDMSGNHSLLQNLSDHLGELIQHIALVGLTDWKAAGRFSNIPKTQFFFAPNHFKTFYQEYGAERANQMLNEALVGFIHDMKELTELAFITDFEQLSQLYLEMVDGKVDPKKGYVVKIGE